MPADLAVPDLDPNQFFSAAEIRRSERYERFLRIDFLLAIAATVVALAVLARRAPRFARGLGLGPIAAGVVVGMVTLAVLWAVDLPFSIAAEWWNRHHDLSHGSWIEWLVAPWAELLGSATFVTLEIVLVMLFARRFRRFWWLAVWPIFVAVTALFIFVSPYLLALDVEAPRDPALRRDAAALAQELGVSGTAVDVEKVSEYTDQANAFATGLGPTERIALYDTLLRKPFDDDEIRVVVAHEFAHISRDHLWKGLAWFALLSLPGLALIHAATARRGGLGDPGVLPYGLLVFVVLNLAAAPFSNAVSRRYEAEADWVALQATEDPRAVRGLFEAFARTSLGQSDPPAWSHVVFGTHPTLMERIAMARAWAERAPATSSRPVPASREGS